MNYILIYHSRAKVRITEKVIIDILNTSVKNNSKVGITGCLLYFNDEFLQILEGDKDKITTLYEVIKQDERHEFLEMIWEGESDEKIFENWDMAFRSISNTDMSKITNYLNIDNIDQLIDIFYKVILNVNDKERVSKQLFSYISREILTN